MTELDKIKSKLKKLFTLSRSPNANEAALALEMAQKLMIKHGIKYNDIGEFEIIEENIKGNGGKRPTKYELYLIQQIAKAFGCQFAYGFQRVKENALGFTALIYGHTFVGLEHRVQIACFIAKVLLRKLKKARKGYMKKLTRVCIKTNKIKRADDFCFGWVCTVVDKLNQFTNTIDEQTAIDNYVANLNWKNTLKSIDRGKISAIDDFRNGRREGTGVQIQHGVDGNKSGVLFLEAAQ